MTTPVGTKRIRKMLPALPKAPLSGDRFTLGHYRHKVSGWTNGVPWESWDQGFVEDDIWYQPDIYWRYGQITVDENHGKPPYRTGGPFQTLKFQNNFPNSDRYADGTYYNAQNTVRYEGGFMPPFKTSWANYPEEYLVEDSAFYPSVAGLGDWAWRKTKPDLERADLFVDLREARDIPRMLKTSSLGFHEVWKDIKGSTSWKDPWTMGPKHLANQFLNVQFGWLPFLKSLTDLNKVMKEGSTLILKLIEKNGRAFRRKVPLFGTVETKKLLGGNYGGSNSISYPIHCFPRSFPSSFFSGVPSWELHEDVEAFGWGVGKWEFYNPNFDVSIADFYSPWRDLMRRVTVLGGRISPSNLYESMPWSWLIDWFTNLGDLIDHWTDVWYDSIVAHYCYAMQRKKVTRRFIQRLPFVSGHVDLEFTRFHETKQRIAARSPYGFSMSWDQLDPRRLSILNALGVTRFSGNYRNG